MRGEPGTLGHYGGVQVTDPVSLAIRQSRYMRQQLEAVGPLEARIGVRKVLAHITLGNSAEDGV
jgi:hypothetical protein